MPPSGLNNSLHTSPAAHAAGKEMPPSGLRYRPLGYDAALQAMKSFNHGIHGTHGKAAWLFGPQFGVFRGSKMDSFLDSW